MSEYANYNNMVTTVCAGMQQLEDVSRKLELTEIGDALSASRKKLGNHRFSVGILGEFKRGKSMVINSLLGEEILPSDIEPATATMNRVTYDVKPHAELLMKDGSIRNVNIGDLKRYITKITAESKKNSADIEEAVVYYPCPFCQNSVDIVDTPGLNDDERMAKITEEVIPRLDAVVMVLVHDNPFSISEAEFVRTKLMTSDLGRIIFLVNKIDTIRKKEDAERAVEGIKNRIREKVLERMKEIYSEDTDEYRQMVLKLDGIKVLPFSAMDAFEGKRTNDKELIERSRTVEFEKELTKMLAEDRGAIELGGPISVITRYSKEIGAAAQLKKEAINRSEEEIERTKEETIAAIEQARLDKKTEKKRIKAAGEKNYNECVDMLGDFYSNLRTAGCNVIDEKLRDIKGKDIIFEGKEKKLKESIISDVKEAMDKRTSDFMEIVINKISSDINADMEISNKFILDTTSAVSDKLTGTLKTDLVGIGVDVLTDFIGINGVGGIISGFKQAGVKGAVVGGGIGLVANLAVYAAIASLGLPAVIISCAAGTFASKLATKFIFGKNQVDKLKDSLYELVDDTIAEIKEKLTVEQWIRKTVSDSYEKYEASVEEEIEKFLEETSDTIRSITADAAKNEAEKKQLAADCDEALEAVSKVTQMLRPIYEKIVVC